MLGRAGSWVGNSSGGGGGSSAVFNPFSTLMITEDFCTGDYNGGGYVVSENVWRTIQAGAPGFTCHGATTPSVLGHPGVLQITVSVAGVDVGSIASGSYTNNPNSFMVVGGGAWQLDLVFNIPTLSNGTNNSQLSFGFMDGPPGSAPSNSIYINYEAGASANWSCQSYASSVNTAVVSSLAVTAGYHRGTILINAAGTLLTFSMDGTQLGTISTNIPTVPIEFLAGYRKTVGSGALAVGIDQIVIQEALTTTR